MHQLAQTNLKPHSEEIDKVSKPFNSAGFFSLTASEVDQVAITILRDTDAKDSVARCIVPFLTSVGNKKEYFACAASYSYTTFPLGVWHSGSGSARRAASC